MSRGLGKIQRIVLHILSQYPTGLPFSKLKRRVPEDISKTKGHRLCFSKSPQRKFNHNIYMALKGLERRGLIEIDPYGAWNRLYKITQKGIEHTMKHLGQEIYPINIKITPEDSTEGKSLYEIMENQALNNAFNLEKLLEMGYSINEIERTSRSLVIKGILSHEDWEKINEAWLKQWE